MNIKYKDTIGVSDEPVVMSGGLFSNLNTFEDFGNQLIDQGQDVWLIEITGGPNTDCPTCPNYNYEDLVDYYFPASIAGVLAYSGKNNTNYIGHSNGGRSALVGLNMYSISGKENAGYIFNYETGQWDAVDLPSHPIKKFFGVAVPSVLNNDTTFTYLARKYGNDSINNLQNKNHTNLKDYAYPMVNNEINNLPEIGTIILPSYKSNLDLLAYLALIYESENQISYNTIKYYNDIASENNTQINLSNLEVEKLYLFNGYPTDLIVPYSDAYYIYFASTRINESDKYIKPYNQWNHLENHVYITDNSLVKTDIKEGLKNE